MQNALLSALVAKFPNLNEAWPEHIKAMWWNCYWKLAALCLD